MKTKSTTRPQHFFICTKLKEGKSCCGGKGSLELVEKLKELSKNEGWRKDLRIVSSGCLGHCEQGITCRLEPQGILFTEVSKFDFQNLVSFLKDSLKS